MLSGTAGNFSAFNEGERTALQIEADDGYADMIRSEIEDKIADIIAVNYKYGYFADKVRPQGLGKTENGILISALISADIDEDKQYVKRRIVSEREYAVDGLFHFRLSPLRKKWESVISYVPKTFSVDKLKDFISFLLEEKKQLRIFIENGRVYDRHFRRLNRTFLTGRQYKEDKLLNEILLSGCGEAELLSPVSEGEEEYLREYLGGKIIFGKTYFNN